MSLDKTFIAANLINAEDAASRARVDQHNTNADNDIKNRDNANEIHRLSVELRNAQGTSNTERILKEKVDDFEKLLSKPMIEIAKQNSDFKKSYEINRQMIAELILGQKTYKEMALQYGKRLGKTPEEVLEEFKGVQTNVFNNKAEFEKVDTELLNDLQASERRRVAEQNERNIGNEKGRKILAMLEQNKTNNQSL